MGRRGNRRGPEVRRRIGGGGDSRERKCGSKSCESGGSSASCAPCTGKSVATNMQEEDTGKVMVADAWPIYIEEEGRVAGIVETSEEELTPTPRPVPVPKKALSMKERLEEAEQDLKSV